VKKISFLQHSQSAGRKKRWMFDAMVALGLVVTHLIAREAKDMLYFGETISNRIVPPPFLLPADVSNQSIEVF
jgi:hypothetical protein